METGGNPIPKKVMDNLVEQFGNNPWPEEFKDLVNPTIEANATAPPMSGRMEFINTEYHYHWAGPDRDGQSPVHERVEELRSGGWEYATTKDVRLFSQDCIRGKNKEGFSDELRSGDRRLMKCPMKMWKSIRKGQNIAALQMAYPQALGEGSPMTSALNNGTRTYLGSETDIAELQARRNESNTSVLKVPK
ncbi:MAG TPA: hypothetical protein VH187_18665 [Scandinavium sp.]|jgi:hypothetical protein|uniref:hypothetical protein n=1 Tax=Scandinavium sp. TaxID=2830653 RepID=UPI002E349552|nr:hypothetical protein [Scandinavium sp.]HEX4503161.1 hypothetical protein [Scandinavium sp.]